MTRAHYQILSVLLLCVLGYTVSAGEKGQGPRGGMGPDGGPPRKPFQMILDHAADLGLIDDQKTKLLAMQQDAEAKMQQEREAMREKMKDDPTARENLRAMMEARKNNDQAKMDELRKQMREKFQQENGGKMKEKMEAMKAQIASVLNQEQMKKLKEVMENQMAEHSLGGDDKPKGERRRPSSDEKAPKLYENSPTGSSTSKNSI